MGFLDNAGVDRVWKKFKKQLSNYLPLTGGTMKGLLNVPYGTAVHYTYGTQNSDGYVRLATMVIKTGYTNAPIELTITRRGDSQPTKIVVQFNNTDSNDPSLRIFSVFGETADIWLYKSAVSTWELYVKKNDWFDEVDVTEYHNPTYNNITVTWQKDQISTLPDGAVQATVGEFLGKASSAKSASEVNGHTVDADVPSDAKFTDTTYTAFQGTEGTHDGTSGLVPAPKKSEFGNSYGLGSDGTWRDFGETFVSQSFAEEAYATNEALKNAIEELKKYVDKQSPGGVTLGSVYPVGSIYISVNDNFNPNDVFPGTWVSFGKGRTLVGVDTSDPEFQSSEDTGGEKMHTLTVDELPEHNHDVTVESKELKGSVWNFVGQNANYGPGNSTSGVFSKGGDGTCFYPSSTGKATGINDGFAMDATHNHTASASNTGSGMAHNNMPPYITVYMWKRTA